MRYGSFGPPRKVVVLGAGITGLTAANEAVKFGARGRPVEVTVLEASPCSGGKVRTEMLDGQVVETGPDSFITVKPDMLDLVRELGLESELINTGPDAGVSVLIGGRLVPMPAGMNLIAPTKVLPFAFSSLLSLKAKVRMALEPFVPPKRDQSDESLADFTRRRLGPEALERLVGPMLAGIYAGDPERMSVRSTFPQLIDMERSGGLVKSMWVRRLSARKKRGNHSMFVTIKGGLSKIIEALERKLPPRSVRTDCPVTGLRRSGDRWEVLTPSGPVAADTVISALPASALADAIEGLDPELAMRLREFRVVSTATTTLIYDAKDIPRPPRGFGFLSPRAEQTTVTAVTYSSSKFPSRYEPAGRRVVIRAFVGGEGREADAEAAVTRLEMRAREDIDRILGLKGAKPLAAKTTRWLKSNPQYEVGHSRRLDRLTSCLKSHPGLWLAGSSFDGVGLPDCVRSAKRAAERALSDPRRRNDAARA